MALPRSFRARFRHVLLVALACAGFAPGAVLASTPGPCATVVAIEPTRVADLVLLGNGFNAGLRRNMVCRVTRGPVDIAEILLVELRPNSSAALILNVAPRQAIRAGDSVAIKVLKT